MLREHYDVVDAGDDNNILLTPGSYFWSLIDIFEVVDILEIALLDSYSDRLEFFKYR